MHPQRRRLGLNVLVGGAAVLASYLYVVGLDAATRAALWGDVPEVLLPAYVASMAIAAAGFFAFTAFLLFRADPDKVQIGGRFGYGLVNGFYLMILIPSALWLPLTAAMIQQPSSLLWLLVRLVLALVGLGSLGLLLALWFLRPRQPAKAYWLAVAGAAGFSFQTALLDLFVWTAYFPAQAL